MFHLRPSPHVFFSYYVKWVSLVSQSHNVLFTPFSSSYKYFKDSFFKIVITAAGRHHFFDGDTPKFPLYWTRDPVYYLSWPKSPATEDDKRMFEIMDQLPGNLMFSPFLSFIFLHTAGWICMVCFVFNNLSWSRFLTLLNLYILWQV